MVVKGSVVVFVFFLTFFYSRSSRCDLTFHLFYHCVLFAAFEASTGWNETTNNDVFFESYETIYGARHRCLREFARRVLE